MKIEIKVPAMGESISEATIGQIFKKSGSFVRMDEEILELETDKVNQSLFASESGKLELKVSEEDKVTVGQVIGIIDTELKESESASSAKPKAAPKQVQKELPLEKPPQKEIKKEPPVESKEGLKNRIPKESLLENEQEAPPKEKKAEVPSQVETGERETRKRMSKIRRVIAERLVQVGQEIAMLTTFNEVDLQEVMTLRERYKESFQKKNGVKLGFMSFFVKAVIQALKAIPEVNAYIDGDEIVYRNYYDIGVAVSLENGLIVPVVRNADKLSFAGIEKSISELAERAREGKITVDELKGGGFTITNGGVFGSLLSTPIVNPPQSAILGMHAIKKRPVVINDQIVIRPMMYLALSYDHRIIDGKEAVTFLVMVKEALEDPSRLLLGI